MRNIIRYVFCLAFASVGAWAQTSQINGTVKDSTGAAIPGAAIKATQTATGVVRNATSGATGEYVLTNLPIGPYMVEGHQRRLHQIRPDRYRPASRG